MFAIPTRSNVLVSEPFSLFELFDNLFSPAFDLNEFEFLLIGSFRVLGLLS
jgi:hypothetical protein